MTKEEMLRLLTAAYTGPGSAGGYFLNGYGISDTIHSDIKLTHGVRPP